MSAGNIRTIEFEGGSATYDSDMPMSALRGLLESSAAGDLGGLIEALTGIVKSWTFEGSPENDEDWDALRRSQFNAVVKGVTGDLAELGE